MPLRPHHSVFPSLPSPPPSPRKPPLSATNFNSNSTTSPLSLPHSYSAPAYLHLPRRPRGVLTSALSLASALLFTSLILQRFLHPALTSAADASAPFSATAVAARAYHFYGAARAPLWHTRTKDGLGVSRDLAVNNAAAVRAVAGALHIDPHDNDALPPVDPLFAPRPRSGAETRLQPKPLLHASFTRGYNDRGGDSSNKPYSRWVSSIPWLRTPRRLNLHERSASAKNDDENRLNEDTDGADETGDVDDDSACLSTPHHALAALDDALSPPLRAYATFHATARRRLASGASDVPILLWRCPASDGALCGGVGDRLRGIRFSLLLAVLTRRVFLLDWPDSPYPLTAAFVPQHIDWTVPPRLRDAMPPVVTGFLLPLSRAHADWHRNLNLSSVPLPLASGPVARAVVSDKTGLTASDEHAERKAAEMEIGMTADLANGPVRAALAAFDRQMTITTVCRHTCVQELLENSGDSRASALRAAYGSGMVGAARLARALSTLLFRPTDGVQTRASRRGFEPNSGAYVSLHLRTGVDVREERLARFTAFNAEAAAPRLAAALLRCGRDAALDLGLERGSGSREGGESGGKKERQLRAFVATDSALHRATLFARARAEGWAVRASMRRVMHIDLRRGDGRASRGDRGRLRCERFLDVFADLVALSRAAVVVGTKSGFSESAFFMGRARQKVLFFPTARGGSCETELDVA